MKEPNKQKEIQYVTPGCFQKKGKLETIILKMKPNSCNVETLTMEQFAENMKR